MSKKLTQNQRHENDEVLKWYRCLDYSLDFTKMTESKKFRHCSAIVRTYVINLQDPDTGELLLDDTFTVHVLQSYNTDVAYFIEELNLGIDVLRLVYGYTATSCQHISKFFNDYTNIFHLSRTIRYYC